MNGLADTGSILPQTAADFRIISGIVFIILRQIHFQIIHDLICILRVHKCHTVADRVHNVSIFYQPFIHYIGIGSGLCLHEISGLCRHIVL